MASAELSRPARGLFAAFLVLLLNSGYLAAFASPTLFYFSNVALHVLLGVLLLGLGTRWLVRWRTSLSGLGALTALLLVAGGVAGLALSVTGATRAWRWLLVTHIVLSTAGAIAAVALGLPRAVRAVGRPRPAHAFIALAVLGIVGWSSA
ncbi:MAG: hypothetical protein ACRD09_10905, partial [Vicinamibacterales bacterium]